MKLPKPKKISLKNLRKKADDLWSKLIRSIGYCEICGSNNTLNAHHVIGRANYATRYLKENGVCLCVNCHKSFHKIYGKNTTKEMFLEFIELHH